MNDIKHTTIIEEKVYTDKLKSIKTRTKEKLISTDATLLTDYIKLLKSITDHSTDEMEITLKRCPTGEIKITKTWLMKKEAVT